MRDITISFSVKDVRSLIAMCSQQETWCYSRIQSYYNMEVGEKDLKKAQADLGYYRNLKRRLENSMAGKKLRW
jgi:hypothetical protein